MNAHTRKTRAVKIEFREESGPTPERLLKSLGEFVVGDDQRGTKVYHFQDTHLARLYKRFGGEDKSAAEQEQLGREFLALIKYREHWYYAGLEANVGSANLDRVQSSGSDLGAGERFAHHVATYRNAVKKIGMWPSHVVEHIACRDRPVADCTALGMAITPYTFRKMLRKAAADLASHWGH
jgi:hypothetical protein